MVGEITEITTQDTAYFLLFLFVCLLVCFLLLVRLRMGGTHPSDKDIPIVCRLAAGAISLP